MERHGQSSPRISHHARLRTPARQHEPSTSLLTRRAGRVSCSAQVKWKQVPYSDLRNKFPKFSPTSGQPGLSVRQHARAPGRHPP